MTETQSKTISLPGMKGLTNVPDQIIAQHIYGFLPLPQKGTLTIASKIFVSCFKLHLKLGLFVYVPSETKWSKTTYEYVPLDTKTTWNLPRYLAAIGHISNIHTDIPICNIKLGHNQYKYHELQLPMTYFPINMFGSESKKIAVQSTKINAKLRILKMKVSLINLRVSRLIVTATSNVVAKNCIFGFGEVGTANDLANTGSVEVTSKVSQIKKFWKKHELVLLY